MPSVDRDNQTSECLPSAPLLCRVNKGGFPSRKSWREFLWSDVNPEYATGPLSVYCFMTGFIDAISFTAVFVWCGFQTGNFAQIALAVARLSSTHEFAHTIVDLQAIVSLVAFNLGALAGRIGDRLGPHTRLWLVSGTMVQALITLLAGVCIQMSGEGSIAPGRAQPSWTNGWTSVGLALMAASLGLQGVMSKRLNTHFSTSVVLTALWIELFTDPLLFRVRQKVASRDHRMLALVALFTGAVVARLLLGKFGAPATLGFGAGIRMFIAAGWVFVPGKGDGYTRLWDEEPAEDADEIVIPTAEVPSYGSVARSPVLA
ncbi:hypothetical protein C8R43DRAFT_493765 [Mycena crocata]|nr:hypothetical protein C8R43DRAFT_493765 [Mycena crocata]